MIDLDSLIQQLEILNDYYPNGATVLNDRLVVSVGEKVNSTDAKVLVEHGWQPPRHNAHPDDPWEWVCSMCTMNTR